MNEVRAASLVLNNNKYVTLLQKYFSNPNPSLKKGKF
jgi:hypothetical protein